MTVALTGPVASRTDAPDLRVVLAGLMTVMGLGVIVANIINATLPRIVADLGGMARTVWTTTAFLLAMTISAPLYGPDRVARFLLAGVRSVVGRGKFATGSRDPRSVSTRTSIRITGRSRSAAISRSPHRPVRRPNPGLRSRA